MGLPLLEVDRSPGEGWLSGPTAGRCGPEHPLPSGAPAGCNPLGRFPCCNTRYLRFRECLMWSIARTGWCGRERAHCRGPGSINYSREDAS